MDLAPSLGCKADDVACLCKNMDFAYGVRDCTTEACGAQDLPAAAAAAARYCPGNAPSGSQEPRATATSKQTASPTGAPRPSEASPVSHISASNYPCGTHVANKHPDGLGLLCIYSLHYPSNCVYHNFRHSSDYDHSRQHYPLFTRICYNRNRRNNRHSTSVNWVELFPN